MKNNNMNRLVALLLAVLLFVAPISGCVAHAATADGYEAFRNATESKSDINTAAPASEQEVDCYDAVEEIQKQLDAANKALAEAEVSFEALKAENAKLTDELEAAKAEIDALKAEVVPAVEVIDGAVYCDVDYFIERATVTFADGTAALHAIEEGTEVVLDDVHALNERGNYRANTMMLPINGGSVAVTFDGKNAIAANLHQHKSVWTLCKGSAIETGFELVEKQKDGVEAEWLQVTAVCVENAASEFGYDFYVVVKEEPPVVYYPTVQQPESQPEPQPEDKDEIEVIIPDDQEPKPDEQEPKPEPKPEPEPGHNDLEDLPDPNVPDDEVKPGHNDLEDLPDPNQPDDQPAKDNNTESVDPGHNDLGEDDEIQEELPENGNIIPDSEGVIDTTLNPSDPSNDTGHSGLEDDEEVQEYPENGNIIPDSEGVIDTTLTPSDPSNDTGHSALEDITETIIILGEPVEMVVEVNSGHSALD